MVNCPKCNKETELMVDGANDYWYVCHPCKWMARKCEVYSRVVGYLRPTDGWNRGKQEEFAERKTYKIKEGQCH